MIRPDDKRTFAVLRCPEFGFLGFVMPTFRHTPFRAGRPTVAGERGRRAFWFDRPCVRTWFSVASLEDVVVNRRVVELWLDTSVRGRVCGSVDKEAICVVGLERVSRRSACRTVREGKVAGIVAQRPARFR